MPRTDKKTISAGLISLLGSIGPGPDSAAGRATGPKRETRTGVTEVREHRLGSLGFAQIVPSSSSSWPVGHRSGLGELERERTEETCGGFPPITPEKRPWTKDDDEYEKDWDRQLKRYSHNGLKPSVSSVRASPSFLAQSSSAAATPNFCGLAQQSKECLADQIRIGLPFGKLHDLPFEEVDRGTLCRPYNLRRIWDWRR